MHAGQRSFVATAAAIGEPVPEALAAVDPDVDLTAFAARLRATSRAVRATALAEAIHDVVVAIDEATLPMTLVRARILEAPEAVRTSTAEGAPRARRIPAALVEARAEAERALAGAHEEAERIVAAARASAAATSAAAAVAAREEATAKLAAGFLALRAADEERASRDLDRVVTVAVLLAERLVGEALRLEPERIGDLAAAAIAEARGARRIKVEAAPDDVAALASVLGAIGHHAEVAADPALRRGSLVVHTDVGKIDARLEPQLERLAAALREVLA